MITKKQYMIISYFLSRFLFFGGGISHLFALGKVDTWIACILGFLLGLVAFKLLHIFQIKNNEKSFLDVIKSNIILKCVTYLFCFILLNYTLISITVMTNSFFLFKTTPLLIGGCFLLAIVYGVSKKEKIFARVAELLFPISIIVFLFKSAGYGTFALNYTDNLFPMFYTKIPDFILCATASFAYSFIPNILLLSFANMNMEYKDMIKGYAFAGVTIVLTILIVGMVFGYPLAAIIRYPEYMVLKKISLFEFIKNIENILTITWEFDCIVSGFVIVNVIKKINNSTLPQKIQKVTYPLLILLSLIVAVYFFQMKYENTLAFYHNSTYIIAGIGLLLLVSLLFLVRKKKNN